MQEDKITIDKCEQMFYTMFVGYRKEKRLLKVMVLAVPKQESFPKKY